ncbi:hypothetical protein LX16_0341 [Stackebrandtia albiflava]|uniref:Uncharacterized protein n=1 Tax=Stackebrandtia albiflava TaxID=406432 RepID=A0A562V9U7_9ACTN|nr:hypothetical protein [Stackebrandtia albiflava]TWJ14654.1 hypothetical protein LX16_0341 [Stackebrandtia albiflava]
MTGIPGDTGLGVPGEIEYGRFSDPTREYVVTSSAAPHTVRVYALDGEQRAMVCTIAGVDGFPRTSWGAPWVSNFPEWKRRFESRALEVYESRPRPIRLCDG